jgi:hypothetical protein
LDRIKIAAAFSFSNPMKKTLMTLAAVAVALLTGCTSLDKLYRQEVVQNPPGPITTNIVLVTNIVRIAPAAGGGSATNEIRSIAELKAAIEEAATNQAIALQSQITPKIQVTFGEPTFTTNLVARPEVQTGIAATSAIPGWGAAVAAGLGALYAGYRNVRNRKVAAAVIEGIQDGRELLQALPDGKGAELDAKIKELLLRAQLNSGVVDEVKKLLDATIEDHERVAEKA